MRRGMQNIYNLTKAKVPEPFINRADARKFSNIIFGVASRFSTRTVRHRFYPAMWIAPRSIPMKSKRLAGVGKPFIGHPHLLRNKIELCGRLVSLFLDAEIRFAALRAGFCVLCLSVMLPSNDFIMDSITDSAAAVAAT